MRAPPVPWKPHRYHGAYVPTPGAADRRTLLVALVAALLLHAAALSLALPKVEIEPPPPPDPPPKLTRFKIPPPPMPDRPVEPPNVIERQVPVPFDTRPDLTPVDDAPVPQPEEFEPDVDVILAPAQAPPPDPTVVYDERTRDLVLPRALPGRAKVEFPHPALVVRLPGRVILKAVVTKEGDVDSIEVLDVTRPDLGFSKAAVEAVSRWKYEPATLDGRPVAVRLTVLVEFNLN